MNHLGVIIFSLTLFPALRTKVLQDSSSNKHETPASRDFWVLPLSDGDLANLTRNEVTCLAKEMVYWPADRSCYQLATQGPCQNGFWLVARPDYQNQENRTLVRCVAQQCACQSATDCQVEGPDGACHHLADGPGDHHPNPGSSVVHNGVDDLRENRYEVSELCPPGEELLVNPTGVGECGCKEDPPHARWHADGACYQLYTQGPCAFGYQLRVSMSRMVPTCLPALCPDSHVLWEDGQCYELGQRGAPCSDEVYYLALDRKAGFARPTCQLDQTKIARLFDLIRPSQPNAILKQRSMKRRPINILPDCGGENCQNRRQQRRIAARDYVVWLNEMMNRRQS